jgi:hypothetical protein
MTLKQVYRGLANAPLNPLGNAVVACYALERCYDVVLEPAVAVRDTTLTSTLPLRWATKL